MKSISTLLLFILSIAVSFSQNDIKGQLIDGANEAVSFANVVLYNAQDSAMVKVESSDVSGLFNFKGINNGSYYVKSSFIGFENYTSDIFSLTGNGKDLNFGRDVSTWLIFDQSASNWYGVTMDPDLYLNYPG